MVIWQPGHITQRSSILTDIDFSVAPRRVLLPSRIGALRQLSPMRLKRRLNTAESAAQVKVLAGAVGGGPGVRANGTTVGQIAERAGVTKSTFFRHFPDKRELLVAGQETPSRLLAEEIAQALRNASPLEAIAAGLERASSARGPMNRELAPRLKAAVAAPGLCWTLPSRPSPRSSHGV